MKWLLVVTLLCSPCEGEDRTLQRGDQLYDTEYECVINAANVELPNIFKLRSEAKAKPWPVLWKCVSFYVSPP